MVMHEWVGGTEKSRVCALCPPFPPSPFPNHLWLLRLFTAADVTNSAVAIERCGNTQSSAMSFPLLAHNALLFIFGKLVLVSCCLHFNFSDAIFSPPQACFLAVERYCTCLVTFDPG